MGSGSKADRTGTFSGHRVERAIIDIGSNTVRLVLYGGAPRAPVVLFNEKVAARLGREIARTGLLADEAIEMAMRGLRRFAILLRGLGVAKVDVVATAAVRDASNGSAFLEQVAALGFEPRLLSGEEEACASAFGTIGAFPNAKGLVADLGGGSLELVRVEYGDCGEGASLPLGTLRLPDHEGASDDKTKANLLRQLGMVDGLDTAKGGLYLVGGTWRSMATYAMESRDYPLTDPHGYNLCGDQAMELAHRIAGAEPDELRRFDRISSMRSEYLPGAAILLQALLHKFQPDRVYFSSWGLREGILYSDLPDFVQQQDPLLAGVGEFAAMRGTPPLLATQVAGWTVGVVPKESQGSERVRLAATMIALSAMQIEPNLRIPLAIDWALHKRWLDVDAAERAMMAAAVAGNGNHSSLPKNLNELASEEQLDEAYCWGLAIRLCRRLGARTQQTFRSSRLSVAGSDLLLSIDRQHADMFGYPNEKDMGLLADRLGLSPKTEFLEEFGADRLGQPG